MSTFNLSHTAQQVDDAITVVRSGSITGAYDSVADLLTYLQGLTSLPPNGTLFTTHGRDVRGDSPTRTFEVKQSASHVADGGMIRTINAGFADYIEMLDWDGDIRDYGAIAVSKTDETTFDSTDAIFRALNTGRDILIPDIRRAGNNEDFCFKMEGQIEIKNNSDDPVVGNRTHFMRNGQRIRGEGGNSRILVQPDTGTDYPGAFDVQMFDIVFDGVSFVGSHAHAWYDPSSTTIPTGKAVAGYAGQSLTYVGGAVIRGNGYDNCKILNCSFSYFNFVDTGVNDPSIIGFRVATGLTVKGCSFGNNYNCIDINIQDQVGRTLITGNSSTSDSKAFLKLATDNNSGASVGTDNNVDIVSHHVITENHVHRAVANANGRTGGQFGINVHSTGSPSHCTISNNVLSGGEYSGILLGGATGTNQGATDLSTNAHLRSGPDIISNNIISYYGGGQDGNALAVDYYTGGIKVNNTMGTIIEGNVIEHCGFKIDGTEADNPACGIVSTRSINDTNISNNIIRHSNGHGIGIVPLSGEGDQGDNFNVQNLRILGNTVTNCSKYQLICANSFDPSELEEDVQDFKSVFIKDNTFRFTGAGDTDTNAFSLVYLRMPRVIADNVISTYYEFSSNTLEGTDNNKDGLRISGLTTMHGIISRNEIRNVNHGIWGVYSNIITGATTTSNINGFNVGLQTKIEENLFQNYTKGVLFTTDSYLKISFVHPNNRFINSVNGYDVTVADRGVQESARPHNSVNAPSATYFGEAITNVIVGRSRPSVRIYATSNFDTAYTQFDIGDQVWDTNFDSTTQTDFYTCYTQAGSLTYWLGNT